MFDKFNWFSSTNNDEKLKKMRQINEAHQFLENFIASEKFKQYSLQFRKQVLILMVSFNKDLEKIDETEQKSTADITKCREHINTIFKNFLALTYNEKDIVTQTEQIDTFFFSNLQLSFEQKENAVYTILTGENERTPEKKNLKLKLDIEKDRAEIIKLANLILNGTQANLGSEVAIFESVITYLSNNNENQANKVLLSLLKTYQIEYEKNLTKSSHYEKISNCQKLILDSLKLVSSDSIDYVNENEIERWYLDYWDSSKDSIAYQPDVRNHLEKTIEICALGWTDLLIKEETQALKLLKSMMTALCQPKKNIKHHNHPFKNFDSLAFFLLKIQDLSQNQKVKIQNLAIKTMGYKIYDLITAHFELESKLILSDKQNCIIYSIIQALVDNTSFKKYVNSALQPIIEVLSERKVTVTKGCHLTLMSSTEHPTPENLNRFELKIMSSIPTSEQFAEEGVLFQKNIFVLLQPVVGEPPRAIYLVDRRDKKPLVTKLSFAPKQDIFKLVKALFPSVTDYIYSDLNALHASLIDELAEKTNLFHFCPKLIKRKGKNSFYLHTSVGQLHEFGTGNSTLLNYLKELNSNSNFSNSEKIWLSAEHHPTLYQAVIPLPNNGYYLKEFNYDGEVDLLKEAFVESFNQLFAIQNYPPELIRILYEYLQIDNEQLLSYLITEFINPIIKTLGKDSSNLKFWYEKIILLALEALSGNEEKNFWYPKRIAKPVLDFIYSKTLENYLAQFCTILYEVHVPELEFNILFINPYLQLAEDAGLSKQIKNIDLSKPYETQIKHFPKKLSQLRILLDAGKIAQKNKEKSLHQLENLENDFLILCYCYKKMLGSKLTVEKLISPMDEMMKNAMRDFYSSLLLSTFSKLKNQKMANTQQCFNHIKERKEYSKFKDETEEEQLLIFSQKISKQIWDKKVHEISEDAQIIPTSKISDTHFERLEFLEKSFERFDKDRMGTFIKINLNDDVSDKKYRSNSFIINRHNIFSHNQPNSYIQKQDEKSIVPCKTI